MDPNETLRILRKLSVEINDLDESSPDTDLSDKAIEMATTFDFLDNWICNGGFLPKSWEVKDGR